MRGRRHFWGFLTAGLLPLAAAPARAALYLDAEPLRPLPAEWPGFLRDHRALRLVGAPAFAASSPLRDGHAELAAKLEALGRTRPHSADEAAELGGLRLRLGRAPEALAGLRDAARRHPDHFRLAAHLGTAWQLAGDLAQAESSLRDSARLSPPESRGTEELHFRLVVIRRRDRNAMPSVAAGDAAAAQRLALSLPGDGAPLAMLAEVAAASGDERTAANLLDGCAQEYGMTLPTLLARRRELRVAVDRRERDGDHTAGRGTLRFASPRALVRGFDPSRLPPIPPAGAVPLPWGALGETEVGPGFRPRFLPFVERLDGREVVVAGHLRPGLTAGDRFLTEYPVGCWFCEAPGPAASLTAEFADAPGEDARGPVKVTGVLRLNRADPEEPLFRLEGARARGAD